MLTSIVDNSSGLARVLAPAIAQARDARIAVAFASAGGVKLIEPAILECLDMGAHVEFIVGMDLNVNAKIRQQLQVLREMGLIEHLRRERWKKL